jgi:solute carrier family 25 phosphate transporter 23/24/25/41
MVAQCFVYPLDTLKFRMQCETVEGGLKGNRLIAATAKKMINTNGILGFFRGLPLGLVGMFPYAAIDLTTFEYLKRALLARKARLNHCHEDDVPLNNFTTGAIGAFSGAFGASVVYPLNVLRTRLQAQGTILHPATYDSIGDVARKTLQTEGPRGLYKGITPNLLKVVPAVSISYVVYENSKRFLGLK